MQCVSRQRLRSARRELFVNRGASRNLQAVSVLSLVRVLRVHAVRRRLAAVAPRGVGARGLSASQKGVSSTLRRYSAGGLSLVQPLEPCWTGPAWRSAVCTHMRSHPLLRTAS